MIGVVRQDEYAGRFASSPQLTTPRCAQRPCTEQYGALLRLGGQAGAVRCGDFAFMAKSIRTYIGGRVSQANHSAFGRARRFGRIPPEDILLRMELQEWECFYCADKITLFTCELDHVVPLAGGGEHFLYNIVLACRTCNNTKRARSLKRFCEIMRLNLNETRQRWAELNAQQHALTNFDDEYGSRTAQDADSLGNG